MGPKGKIALAVLGMLGVLVALNMLAVDQETKDAEATVVGGRILKLGSADVQIVETGPDERRPIVLIHGFGGSTRWWDRVVPELDRHRVIRIDLLGHGGSEKPSSGYAMEEQAAMVAEALANLKVKRATVVGHSMGADVGVALTERSPELVRRLVIIDEAPDEENYGSTSLPEKLSIAPVIGETGWRIAPRFLWERGLEQAFAPGYDVPDEFVDDLRRMTYTSYDQSAERAHDYVNSRPLDERLGRLGDTPPVLVIFGARDERYEVPETPQAYLDVPTVVKVVPDAGHSPQVEKPLQTARLIRRFIATSRRASPTRRGDQRSKKRRARDTRRGGGRGGRGDR